MRLLSQLYSIHSETFREWPMICFVRDYIRANIPSATVRMDRFGNLYIKKGSDEGGLPTLACHMDQVQSIHSGDFTVREEDGMIYGWSESNGRREGLGADDKNGIWICLKCLEQCDKLKVFMAVGEEKGCYGSNRADMSFFKDSLYILEPDCKEGKDIHVVLRGIPSASEDFVEVLKAGDNGFEITPGGSTDIRALTLNNVGVSCANIPVGYHNPHKDDEYTFVSELMHSFEYIRDFVSKVKEKFPHTFIFETQRIIQENYPELSQKSRCVEL